PSLRAAVAIQVETSRASLSMMIPRDQTVSSCCTARSQVTLYTVGRVPPSYAGATWRQGRPDAPVSALAQGYYLLSHSDYPGQTSGGATCRKPWNTPSLGQPRSSVCLRVAARGLANYPSR